jgi:exodeoxyribonuclease VII small subunit
MDSDKKKDEQFDFAGALKKLEEINLWFQQEDIDLEEGLGKLRQGKDLLAQCRSRLKQVENEFTEIKSEMTAETDLLE